MNPKAKCKLDSHNNFIICNKIKYLNKSMKLTILLKKNDFSFELDKLITNSENNTKLSIMQTDINYIILG